MITDFVTNVETGVISPQAMTGSLANVLSVKCKTEKEIIDVERIEVPLSLSEYCSDRQGILLGQKERMWCIEDMHSRKEICFDFVLFRRKLELIED